MPVYLIRVHRSAQTRIPAIATLFRQLRRVMQEEMEQAELVALQQVGSNSSSNDGNGNAGNLMAVTQFDHEMHAHQQQQLMHRLSASFRTAIDAMRAAFDDLHARQNERLLTALAEQSAHIRRLEAVVMRLAAGGNGGVDGSVVAAAEAETETRV